MSQGEPDPLVTGAHRSGRSRACSGLLAHTSGVDRSRLPDTDLCQGKPRALCAVSVPWNRDARATLVTKQIDTGHVLTEGRIRACTPSGPCRRVSPRAAAPAPCSTLPVLRTGAAAGSGYSGDPNPRRPLGCRRLEHWTPRARPVRNIGTETGANDDLSLVQARKPAVARGRPVRSLGSQRMRRPRI